MGVVVVVLIVAVAAAGVWYSFHWKKKRRDAMATFAAQYNLTYSPADPFGIVGYPFHLFSRGDGRGCENVMDGEWQGLPIQEADYWYYDESTDSEGRRSKTYHHFSVVVANLGVDTPEVSIERENIMTRLADHVGMPDIEFESEDFNREFQVKSKDQEFAFKLVDARMMQWLLSTGGKFGFEIMGPWLLVFCKRLAPTALVPLIGTAKAFDDHIPRLVRDEYPGPRAADSTDATGRS